MGAKIAADDGRISPDLGYQKVRLIICVGIRSVKKKVALLIAKSWRFPEARSSLLPFPQRSASA